MLHMLCSDAALSELEHGGELKMPFGWHACKAHARKRTSTHTNHTLFHARTRARGRRGRRPSANGPATSPGSGI